MFTLCLLSERKPKRVLCEATRDSLRPWWSYVARMLFEKVISVWPEKYLTMKPAQRAAPAPMAAHSGMI